MNEPKPMTKERRERIEELANLESEWVKVHPVIKAMLQDALSAEQYWRELVKNFDFLEQFDDYVQCGLCSQIQRYPYLEGNQHKPDCPWQKSQS